jgi:tRNA-specific 2-thiouridylase
MTLPIGDFEKSEIRRRAAELGLRVADKRDSQEICFVTSGKHDQFIQSRPGHVDRSGEIRTVDGAVVGSHSGVERFTIGQRKGLGVALGEPRYVVSIDAEERTVVIGEKRDLERCELTASRLNWLVDRPTGRFRCEVQIRYNSPAKPATVEPLDDDRIGVSFDEPRHGVAPGQAAVCYQDDRVLGGGWID